MSSNEAMGSERKPPEGRRLPHKSGLALQDMSGNPLFRFTRDG
jgi:hypothetical protein